MTYYLHLAERTVNGSGGDARSGAQTLVLLATELSPLILRALRKGPTRQTDLRFETGAPAQTTLRAQLAKLSEVGAIEKHRRNSFPGVLDYELSPAGRELTRVTEILERWLHDSPDAPLTLGSNAAKAAIKALVEGWNATVLRALAARPLALTELDRVISAFSYPALERRLSGLRVAGLIEYRPGAGRGTPYGVNHWLRRGVATIAAASRWERRHLAESTPPLTRIDIEALLLLAAPLLRVPTTATGRCRLAAEIPSGAGRLAGVTIELENGGAGSFDTRLDQPADAWALGAASAWLDAMAGGDVRKLELGGDGRLARAVLDGLHEGLFVDTSTEREIRTR